MTEIRITPVTRLEGHAQVRITLNSENQLERAHFNVMELRGFEKFLIGAAVEEAPDHPPDLRDLPYLAPPGLGEGRGRHLRGPADRDG